MATESAVVTRHFPTWLPWLEFVLGLFNIHGIAYFFVNRPVTGVLMLLVSLGLHAIGIGTAFIGCLVSIPLGWVLALVLAFNIRHIVRHHNHLLATPHHPTA